ncbi:MAG: aminotransferase class I/II-fold pyridoxal phosphate-dependent enzyme [Cyanobacteria bacterium HKST-UBA03]|nr:aminotransferase class I/II-fold pyridoxal phosphate-dependent enzyme [Cyanobacteria bacterium HKST-UBA03]
MTTHQHSHPRPWVSNKASQFTESVIREMSRLAAKHQAINLAQGFPDFEAPQPLKDAACQAIQDDINQYAITWGDKGFRDAIAAKTKWYLGLDVDPETQITVTCGATEAMMSAMLATVNPGDEVIVFEPHYENYGPDAILCGAVPRYVHLRAPDWHFDEKELEAAFNKKTKAIIINTPHNPTGKVFTEAELTFIGKLCEYWDVLVLTDEIYEHILYDGHRHVAPATIEDLKDRTITINALSKTYSVTGWRVGYIIANAELTGAIRKVHDFLTVGAAAPLQRAGAAAMHLPENYYTHLQQLYDNKRQAMLEVLDTVGIPYFKPQGAYYVFCDIDRFGYADDIAFTRHLVQDIGVAVVPGSSFFEDPVQGNRFIRFCFCKKPETLQAAQERLLTLNSEIKLAR